MTERRRDDTRRDMPAGEIQRRAQAQGAPPPTPVQGASRASTPPRQTREERGRPLPPGAR